MIRVEWVEIYLDEINSEGWWICVFLFKGFDGAR